MGGAGMNAADFERHDPELGQRVSTLAASLTAAMASRHESAPELEPGRLDWSDRGPGWPWQHPYVESFNSRARDDLATRESETLTQNQSIERFAELTPQGESAAASSTVTASTAPTRLTSTLPKPPGSDLPVTGGSSGDLGQPPTVGEFWQPSFRSRKVRLNSAGWGGRIRTFEWGIQSPLPYHLATPHRSHQLTCRESS